MTSYIWRTLLTLISYENSISDSRMRLAMYMITFYLTVSSVVFKTTLICGVSYQSIIRTLSITTVALRSGEHVSRPNQTICDAT